MSSLRADDPLAIQITAVVQQGDESALDDILRAHPELPRLTIQDSRGTGRTLLHVVTDWPGHFANSASIVARLIAAGADPNKPVAGGKHQETPLHWAASSDDVEVAAALLAGGANIEAMGGSIGGGTPLEVAVGYGQWQVARFLATRGAAIDKLWVAAALGMSQRAEQLLQSAPPPSAEELNHALWQACHGGHIRTARLLLAHGANIGWTPSHNDSTPLQIAAQADSRREMLVTWLRKQAASKTAARIRRLRAGEGGLARGMFALMSRVFETEQGALTDAYVEALLANVRFVAIAAFDVDDVVGGTTAYVLPLTGKMSSALFVYDVAVREDRQGMGVGRALMEGIRTEAKALGIDEVFVLANNEDDHAIAFYKAIGGSASAVTMFDLPTKAEP